nr:immunoglobulin heavy chain junction region [Mus musculus]NSM06581.1 immunoglobulin heavy chain junction region [Mus musculus]NSM07174.1 immunoglobulin heavy chain junction region [Mus musculus]NSM07562.1 immunoglobulin heavy chain junction region [Mus musculus]NSM09167.1 immunoglobulin heavy chain junction region [Mus musculus]
CSTRYYGSRFDYW